MKYVQSHRCRNLLSEQLGIFLWAIATDSSSLYNLTSASASMQGSAATAAAPMRGRPPRSIMFFIVKDTAPLFYLIYFDGFPLKDLPTHLY